MPIKILSELDIPMGPQVSRMEEFKEAIRAIQEKEVKPGAAIEISLPRTVKNKKALIVSFVRRMKHWLEEHKLEQYRVATREERVYITNQGKRHEAEA